MLIKRQSFTDLISNLFTGFKLSIGMSVKPDDFRFSLSHGLFIFIFISSFEVFLAYAVTNSPVKLDDYGVNYFGTTYLIGIIIFLLIINWLGAKGLQAGQMLLANFSASLILLLFSYALKYNDTYLLEIQWAYIVLYLSILVWSIYITYRLLRIFLDSSILKSIVLAIMNIVLMMVCIFQLEQSELWYEDTSVVENEAYQQLRRLNVEDMYYAQPALLDKSINSLEKHRDQVTDLYLLAFGGYALEKVFLNEVVYVKQLFDHQFDTQGRSMILANNTSIATEYPMANKHNLTYALNSIASNMDTEEDILILFMTSHGSKEHKFSVSYGPIRLNNLSPEDIRHSLDESGIKWRVIIISSCYSGGFIDSLKHPSTLVITASAKDKQSFGCGSESEFTDFGTAYFKKALHQQTNFIKAFDIAKQWIEEKENREQREASLPQIYIGQSIQDKISVFNYELTKTNQTQAVDNVLGDCSKNSTLSPCT